MHDQPSHALPEDLVAAGMALAGLLRDVGADSWAEWMERNVELIERGDRYGIDRLVAAFGGMGSLNDLMIHPMNGHAIEDTEVSSANNRLDELRQRTWRLARETQRELDRT